MLATVLVALVLMPAQASGQDVPDPPDVQLAPPEAIRRGQQAPRDGLFVDPMTYVSLTLQIDGLEHQLTESAARDEALCLSRIAIEHARVAAETDRLTLREGLWQQRQEELLARIREEQHRAERGFFENPLFWFVVGAAAAALAAIVVAVAN